MKTKKITVAAIMMLGISLSTFTSCGQNANKKHVHESKKDMHENHQGHNHNHSKSSAEKSVSEASEKSLLTNEIVNNYMLLKNALVNDNSKKAASAGGLLLTAFNGFDMTTLTEEQHKEYMDIVESAKEQAEHISENADNITHQREHFEVLSTDIEDLLILVGTNKTIYKDHCPMANEGKGANWLSESENILNPYFGSKMLKCGVVKKQFN